MDEFINRQEAIEQAKAEWAKLPLSETTGFGILMRVLTSIPAADVRPVKWTSSTKLPPKEDRVYEDGTVFSVDVVGTEGVTYRKAYYNFKAKVWLDGNNEEEWPEITHWMPLPEPPKEET